MKKPSMRKLREDAEEFVVLIAMKGPDGVSYSELGYADDETDIDYENGVYGYDSAVRENVSAMTRDTATKLAADIVANAPAGDLLVGVVPYSTIPAERGEGFGGAPSEEDFTDEDEETEADEFDDSDFEDEDEESDDNEEEESEEESIEEASRKSHARIRAIQEARSRIARGARINENRAILEARSRIARSARINENRARRR